MTPVVLDHLWQSTLFALLVTLLVAAFRKAPAAVRHGLWLAASVKFLIPFAALAALGRRLAPAIRLPHAAEPEAAFIAKAAQPFSQPALAPPAQLFAPSADLQAPLASAALPQAPTPEAVAHPIAATVGQAAPHLDLSLILLGVWILGSAVVLVAWARRWARLRKVVRSARPVGWPAPMPVLAAPSLVEPGLVGLWRPVLLLPQTLPEHLTRSEIDAILAHEITHLRRRDNFTAAIHMLVEALFWFHPLVWWIGARLIEEREQACDEAVVAAGHDRAAYARSLVQSARLFLQSPLDCVSGASGSSLKTRVEAIMTATPAVPLSRARKALLLAAGACAFATPVMAGLIASPEGQTAVARAETLVSSLAPDRGGQASPALPSSDQTAPAVVLSRAARLLTAPLTVASLDARQQALTQDIATPRIEAPPPSTASPVQIAAAPTPPAISAPQAENPADSRRDAERFVQAYAASTANHVLARWRDPICVNVDGLPSDQADMVRKRVEAVAMAAGVRVGRDVCQGVQVNFSKDPQATLDSARKSWRGTLGDSTSPTRDVKTVNLPIQAWYVTNGEEVARNDTRAIANGLKVPVVYQDPLSARSGVDMPPANLGSGGGGAWGSGGGGPGISDRRSPCCSTPRPPPPHRALLNALVIVDVTRTQGRSLGLISDYVAMLALSQPKSLGACQTLPSVTDLFAGSCPGRGAPDGLTPADSAFLTALYAAKPGKAGEEADIADRMANILGTATARAEAAPARPIQPASDVGMADGSAPVPLTPVSSVSSSTELNRKTYDFVQSHSPGQLGPVTVRKMATRWYGRPICIGVEGLAADQNALVWTRVAQVARSAGVPVVKDGCLPLDVRIVFATDARKAIARESARRGYTSETAFRDGYLVGHEANSPIQAWYNLASQDRELTGVWVVVDMKGLAGVNPRLVSDYIAMLALSSPRSLDYCNALPSVTDLFAKACPDRAKLRGLTAADTAFLAALYEDYYGKKYDRARIVTAQRMADKLLGVKGAAATAPAPAPTQAVRPATAAFVAPQPPRATLIPVSQGTAPTTAQRDAAAFVQSYGGAFWNTDDPICVRVEGLPSDKAAQVKARVEADARAAGVSVGRAECGLRYQVEIRFAADAERAVRDVLNYNGSPVWPIPMDKPAGADRPIRAWYGLVYDHAGAPHQAGEGRIGLGADPGARQKFALAIVVVDPRRTADKSLDAVSDYATMLALSQPRALDRCNVLPSITDLFAGACPDRAAPAGLTAADTAYLKALYTGGAGLRARRYPSEVVDHMARRLAADRRAAL